MAGSSERSSQELERHTVPETMPSLFFSCVEEQIEKSKAHWSVLADHPSSECMAEGEAEVSDVQEFLELQRHPIWGGFFAIFGDHVKGRYGSQGSLEVGEKFAEGAQAEIFHAKVTWGDPHCNEMDLKEGFEYALKVFKKGTYLKYLKTQFPHALLQESVIIWKHTHRVRSYSSVLRTDFLPRPRFQSGVRWSTSVLCDYVWKHLNSPQYKEIPKFSSYVCRGTLLEDGRFAFLMDKEHLDLRTLIECNMKLRGAEFCGPFSNEEAELMMYRVALGVNWLYDHGIVHRDLKASNVFVQKSIVI